MLKALYVIGFLLLAAGMYVGSYNKSEIIPFIAVMLFVASSPFWEKQK